MTIHEATAILTEMQRWHKREGAYTDANIDTARSVPYTPEQFWEAIETANDYICEILS